MGKRLSIIVPVYNCERFILECLNSLTGQLHQSNDVELIIVNDGSTDRSDQIIRSVVADLMHTGQVMYLATENRGVSAARNLGMENAHGDYVSFVDADDLVKADYVSTILATTPDQPDIIEFGYHTVDQSGSLTLIPRYVHTKFGRHRREQVLDHVFAACLWYSWSRVFRKTLFSQIQFPTGVRFCEDLIALTAVYKKANIIFTLPEILYNYRTNPAGATLNIRPGDAQPLIRYYREVMGESDFANKAVKINLAYAIRRCLARAPDLFGRMPDDLERDVRSLIWSPALFLLIRSQFVLFAIWGKQLNFLKRSKHRLSD